MQPVSVSFEFFPPNDAAMEQTLWSSIQRLAPLAPRFVSVTYGADGSTRERTHNVVTRILRETSLTPAPVFGDVAKLFVVNVLLEIRVCRERPQIRMQHIPPLGPRNDTFNAEHALKETFGDLVASFFGGLKLTWIQGVKSVAKGLDGQWHVGVREHNQSRQSFRVAFESRGRRSKQLRKQIH